MKIGFIADASSIHVRRIVLHFLQKGDDVLVLSSASDRIDIPGARTVYLLNGHNDFTKITSEEQNRSMGCFYFVKSLFSPWLKFLAKSTLRTVALQAKWKVCIQEIEEFNPEVIYCFRAVPEGILASKCHVRPLFLRTAGSDVSQFPKYPLYRQMIRKALQTADLVVTESLWESRLIHDLCGHKVAPKVSVIGVDTDRFRPALSRDDLRDRYGLPRDAFVVITNRYFNSPYNGWGVVKSIESILQQCEDLVLLYASPFKMDHQTRARTESITGRFPRIKILDGPRPHSEVPDILGCGDAYISFSSVDGIPNSLLEAMACGLVPIVAELPQFHEWIEDQTNGYFVRQYDTEHLAAVVSHLYKHRQGLSEISARCVSKVRAQASYELCMERTRDLLKQLTYRTVTQVPHSSGSRC
jgi:glycosyltransferase involved in cell wall biosynthesis